MARQALTKEQFETRRHKEQVSFLVVKFLRLHVSFSEILDQFNSLPSTGAAAGSGLFEKVHRLADSVAFDLKEMAHSLFRADSRGGAAAAQLKGRDTLKVLTSMRVGIEKRSIDSYVGTGYHLMLILQESLYQIEQYGPELDREKSEIVRFMEMTRADGKAFTTEEQSELDRLRIVDEITARLVSDSAELARLVMRRCESLLEGTAEVMRRFVISANDNEILLLNLLENRDLLEKVYGDGSSERIFAELCAGSRFPGGSGIERAEKYVRKHCGNISGLGAGSTS